MSKCFSCKHHSKIHIIDTKNFRVTYLDFENDSYNACGVNKLDSDTFTYELDALINGFSRIYPWSFPCDLFEENKHKTPI